LNTGLIPRLRSRLNLATDYDRKLREKWVSAWARGLQPASIVLDAGAGDGHLSTVFDNQSYLAIDIRPKPTSDHIMMCCADLHHIPLQHESVSHVVSVQVLEHVRNPAQVMKEISRVLKQGGTACLSVPQADPEHEQPNDYFRFTSFSLRSLATDSGLTTREIRAKGGYFRRLSSEIRDLPFVILPEDRSYRLAPVVFLVRASLVAVFTFFLATVLLPLDRLDRTRSYTTGYFCVFEKA
jgi:SAM-dependent methyltransferase